MHLALLPFLFFAQAPLIHGRSAGADMPLHAPLGHELTGQEAIQVEIARGPYVQNVTRTGASISFWTTTPVAGSVRIGERLLQSPEGTQHHVAIDGLKEATDYTYTVTLGPVISAPATFRTAPEPGATIDFVAFGDCRSGHTVHEKVVALILKQKPRFVLASGDLVDHGKRSDEWDTFFKIERELLRQIPLYPSLGNHEANAKEYFDIFSLPGNERWYSFDWGPVHVVSLDTTVVMRKDQDQIEWLKQDLAASKAPHKIVIWHHAPYSCSTFRPRQTEAKLLAEIYAPILTSGGVCLALGGHNHNYQRAEAEGVCYITSAGGGATLYDIGEGTELKASKKAYHICRLRADPKTMTLEAIDLEGNVFDRWACERKK